MNLALKNILYFKAATTRQWTSFIMTLPLDVVLFMMSATAALSVKNNILWFVKTFPQISTARTIGKSSYWSATCYIPTETRENSL